MALFVRVIYEIARLPRNHRSRNLSARKPRCRARTEKEREREAINNDHCDGIFARS